MHRQNYFNTRVMQSHETILSFWVLNKYRFKYIIEPVRVFVLNRILIGDPYNGQLMKIYHNFSIILGLNIYM